MVLKTHDRTFLGFIIGFWTGILLFIGCNQAATQAAAEGTTSTSASGGEVYLFPTEAVCVSSLVTPQGGSSGHPQYDLDHNRILAKLDKSGGAKRSCGIGEGGSSSSSPSNSDNVPLKLFAAGNSPSMVWEVRLPSSFTSIATKALALSYVVSSASSTNNVTLTVMDASGKTVTSSSGNATSLSTLSMGSSDLSSLTFVAGDVIHIFATCESASGENCSIGGLLVGWM